MTAAREQQTIHKWLKLASAELGSGGISSPRLDCLLMLESVLGRDRTWLLAHPETKLSSKSADELNSMLQLRLEHTPMAYILGYSEFFGLKLNVNEHVLVPRPETEALVEFAIKNIDQNTSVIDVGTGSGAIALAIKYNRPDLYVSASDVSNDALTVAKQNFHEYSISDIETIHSYLMNDISATYDCVVSNLPYLTKQQAGTPNLSKEPKLALEGGGNDGLYLYRKLLKQLTGRLKIYGQAVLECEPKQHKELIEFAKTIGFQSIKSDEYLLVLTKVKS